MGKRKQRGAKAESQKNSATQARRTRLKIEPATVTPAAKDVQSSRLAEPVVSSAAVVMTKEKKDGGSLVRPTPFECQWIVEALAKLHPEVVERNDQRRNEFAASCGGQDTILDGVVSTILSQNTTSANSTEAFRRLKRVFPTWDAFMQCPDENKVDQLEEAIRCGGLSEIKAGWIHAMLETLQAERGSISLEYLRDLSDDDVKTELGEFKGLGPKTISCVLLFTMGRPEFPVDTHVHRISKIVGWIGPKQSAKSTYEYLNPVVPDHLKLDLHCLLIAHGKACHRCAARGKPQFPPKDGTKLDCPLVHVHKTKGLVMPSIKVLDAPVKKEEL